MARSRFYTAASLAVAILALIMIAAPALHAQDDDDFIKELRKKKQREKAIKEGKDPDAEPEAKEPPKPKLPPTASGWVSTIKRKWDSDRDDDALSLPLA